MHFPLHPHHLWSVLNIGAGTPDSDLNKRVRTTNAISVVTGLLSLCIGLLLFCLSGSKAILVPALIETGLFVHVIYLNSKGRHQRASLVCHVIQCAATLVFGVVLGEVIDGRLMSVFLISTPLLLFKEKWLRIGCIAIAGLALIMLDANHYFEWAAPIPISEHYQPLFRTLSLLTIGFLTTTIVFFYDYANTQLFRRLERSNTLKTLYVREVSHELRTPISAIHNMSDLLATGDLDEENNSMLLRQIVSSARLSADIISNVSTMEEVESGQVKVSTERLEIKTWVRDVVNTYSYEAQSHQIEIITAVADAMPPTVYTAKLALTQILGNLLHNAVKFSLPGGKIRVSISPLVRGWCFSVEDEGIGIAKQRIDKIFDPFYSTRYKNSNGTGLGLYVAKKLLRAIGGEIDVVSEIGKGTAFMVVVPEVIATNGHTGEAMSYPGTDTSLLEGKRVLLAEDDLACAKYVKHILEGVGCQVTHVSLGCSAMVAAKDSGADIIILDNQLTDMLGIDLLRELKSDPDTSAIPVLFMSGDTMGGCERESCRWGAAGFVAKPATKFELLKCVAAVAKDNFELSAVAG